MPAHPQPPTVRDRSPQTTGRGSVFVVGLNGGTGSLLARELQRRGTRVGGLVRHPSQLLSWTAAGVDARGGDLASLGSDGLARIMADPAPQCIVFAAGSNGGPREVTQAIDLDGTSKTLEAASKIGVDRVVFVSVFPEAWRDRDLSDDEDFYFAAKKQADVMVSRTSLDWLIVRPSLLTDGPATGTVALGPAELHEDVSRADVALTLAELVHAPQVRRRVLELNKGCTPIAEVVRLLG